LGISGGYGINGTGIDGGSDVVPFVSIGFKREFGVIWNVPLCSVSYMKTLEGIQVACSDNSLSYAEVYHYHNTIFYRIEETDTQRGNGVGPAMLELVLPCGVCPTFQFRSFVPIRRESSN
jgi:hypothetical protein